MELSANTNYYQAIDDYTLVAHQSHPLWQTQSFLHCVCQADWREYQAVIAQLPQQDWYRDFSGTVGLWFGCEQWQVFKDSLDRVYCYLRDCNLPLNGAKVNHLVLQLRDEHSQSPLLRSKSALNVYVRIDYDSSQSCSLDIQQDDQASEPEHQSLPIESGMLVIVSGFRRHRISGSGMFIHFQLDLPTQARIETLHNRDFHRDFHRNDLSDAHVFATATALPLSQPQPSAQIVQQKINWLESRNSKSYRHNDSPVVRRYLIDNVDPLNATAQELEQVRSHGLDFNDPNVNKVTLIEDVPVLSNQQCQLLRQYVDEHITSIVPDSVDDHPEYQVNLSPQLLHQLLGADTTQKLVKLPKRLDDSYVPDDPDTADKKHQLSIFLRMYSPQTRPYIAFHSDICRYTCVVALNDSREYDGGRFVMIADNRLQIAPWQAGKALLHAGNLIHGVSKLTQGTRYSLVMFVN